MRLYDAYTNGILPNDGGYLSQTSKYTEYMSFIQGLVNKYQMEQNDKIKN